MDKTEQLKKDLLTYSEDLHSSYLFYTMTCNKLLAKIEKIKEMVKKIGDCEHCGWKEECNKGCASYMLLQLIESEE